MLRHSSREQRRANKHEGPSTEGIAGAAVVAGVVVAIVVVAIVVVAIVVEAMVVVATVVVAIVVVVVAPLEAVLWVELLLRSILLQFGLATMLLSNGTRTWRQLQLGFKLLPSAPSHGRL